jgi:Pentapeptide repeats (8 copies)
MKLGEAWGWIKAKPARMIVFVGCGAVLIVALIPTVITWAPRWLASTSGLNATQRTGEVDASRTALLALLAGGVAVVGAVYTARTFSLNRETYEHTREVDRQSHELDRQGQITERFTRAIDQLGSEKLDVRLGGIYALERLARESDEEYGPIVFVLAAHVREHSRWPPAELSQTNTTDPPEAAEDIKAIVAVLRRRKVEHERGDPIQIGLGHTNLCGSRAHGIHLVTADLSGTQLQRADLNGANLNGANLKGAHLENADLENAHLEGAFLKGAHLEGAVLRGAHLEGADLCGAQLSGAFLIGAHLEHAQYDNATRWPEGFEPAKHPVRMRDKRLSPLDH